MRVWAVSGGAVRTSAQYQRLRPVPAAAAVAGFSPHPSNLHCECRRLLEQSNELGPPAAGSGGLAPRGSAGESGAFGAGVPLLLARPSGRGLGL